MEDNYVNFFLNYKKIQKEIYDFCDMNKGKVALFPAFVNCVERDVEISRRDLSFLVSNILDDLIDKNVLEISRECNSDTVYAFYKILKHEDLVKHNAFIEKKMKMLN